MHIPLLSLITILCQTTPSRAAKKPASADLLKIEISDPRPVAAAIIELEKRLGCIITYEDPAYLHPSQMEKSHKGPLIPKWGNISFNILESLLKEYSNQVNHNIFQIKRKDGIYHVFPLKSINEKGDLEQQVSVLDTPISISAQNKNGVDILEMICDNLSQTLKKHVVVGTIPLGTFIRMQESYNFVNKSARDCLNTVLKDFGNNMSWQIFFDPKLKWYVLNIHHVPRIIRRKN